MDPATILALANLAVKYGVPLVTALFRHNADGTVTVSSILLVIDEAKARNAETLKLMADAEAK